MDLTHRHAIPVLTTFDAPPGFVIQRVIGPCWGITVRSRSIVGTTCAGCQQVFGGEISALTKLATDSRNVAMQRSIGIDTRLVDARELRTLVRGIEVDDGAVGAYEPGAGTVDPVRTVQVLAALAREQGAIPRVETTVTELLVERGRIRGVTTGQGSIEAEQVVIATGPWTRSLLARAGVDLPLRVLRPEQHFLAMPATGPATRAADEKLTIGELEFRFAREPAPPPAAHPVLLDVEHGFYTRCESYSGRTRVGRMDYEGELEVVDPDEIDERVSAEFQRWARERLEKRLPVYRGERDVGSIVGLYTVTPDAQALIGPCRGIDGLYVVSGFSGHGFKLAPSIGEGVAQMLWREPVSAFDPAFFDPYRFDREGAGSRSRAFGL